jgi:DNA end-binding protein Ku
VPHVSVADDEVKLAKMLVEASTTDKFDFSRYEDQYTEKVSKLLEQKAAGKRIAPAEGEEEPAVINLMDALRKSLEGAKHGGSSKNGATGGKEHTNGKAKAKKAGSRKSRRPAHVRKTG